MEVKPGYKQTEVGVIPEEWEVAAVADLVEPSAPICYGVVQVGQHIESGVPIVAIKYVKEIAHAPLHRTAVNLEQPYERSRPKGGDVLISIKGTIGRVGIVPNGFPGNISRELARLRIKDDSCPEYIAHQLESGATQERIMRSVVGTTRLEFSIATLRKFPLPVPPTLPEQCAIATALSDVDGLLGGLDRLIAKKRDLKQAAMQQLLTGQTRLPGFHGEWEVKRLGDICRRITTGKLDANAMVADGDYPFFTCARESCWIDKYAFDYEALLVSGNGANIGYVHYYNGKFNAYQRTYVISEFTADVQFIKAFLVRNIQERIRVEVNAGNTPYITMGTLTEMEINLPPFIPEQRAIAEVLTAMDAELAALTQRREKTRALKQAMMQELLTGRTRLVARGDAEARSEE